MQRYAFRCKNCQQHFFVIAAIEDEQKRHHAICPFCKSEKVARIFNAHILKGKKAKGYHEEEELHTSEPEETETSQCSPEDEYQ